MNRIYLIVTLVIALGLTACSDFVSPDRFDKAFYTLNTILKAGNTISIENPVWIGKTTSIENINAGQLFVTNAAVRILQTAHPSGDTLSFVLLPVTFPVPGSSQSVTFYIDPLSHVIQPEYTYSITVNIPGYAKTITAETTVPKFAELMPNFEYAPPAGNGYTTDPQDTTTYIPFEEINAHYPVTIKVDGAQSVNYLVELYCMEPFSTDLEFTSPFLGVDHPDASMENQYNQASGETVRRINILGKFVSSQHDDGDWYVGINHYRQAFVFYGRYQVTATVMDDNYYKTKYMPEGYYHGGVHNGLGCFGSSSGGVMYTKIVKQ